MKWITREDVKVDRVACPWLINRFIDPDAEFEFLSKDTDSCSAMHGTLFHVPGCELGRHGQDVSLNSILKKHVLNDPALRLLAETVRAADSRPINPHEHGKGLRWIAHRLSKLSLSDHEPLNREFILYHALYAEWKEKRTPHATK